MDMFPSIIRISNECASKFLDELKEKHITIPDIISKINDFYNTMIKENKMDKVIINKKSTSRS